MAQEAKGIRYQLQLGADAKDSLKSRMRENRKYGSEEGRRQQCRPPTQQIHKRSGLRIEMIAELINPVVRGWMNYFGRYNRSAMRKTLAVVQRRLIKWAMCKYKHFRGHRRRAECWLKAIQSREPNMFAHWALC